MQVVSRQSSLGVKALSSAHKAILRKPLLIRRFRAIIAWLIWIVSLFFVLFQFAIQLSSGQILAGLQNSFGVSALGAGVIASTYYYVYVLLQTPAGIMMDRFGPRALLSVGAMVCALGCEVFAVSSSMYVAIFGRILMGMGAAFAFVGCAHLVSKWFPARRFAFMIGILEMMALLGSIFGGLILAYLVEHIGWRDSMMGAALIALVLGVFLAYIIRDMPAGPVVRRRLIILKRQDRFINQLKSLLKRPLLWINGAYSGILFSVISVFVALWGIPFIMVAKHVSLVRATFITDIVAIGVACSCPVLGWLNPRIHCRRYIMSGFAACAAALFMVIIFFPHMSDILEYVLLFLIGICSSCYMLTFAIATELASVQAKGTSLGFTNTMSVGFAPILQPLIGGILHFVYRSHIHGTGLMSYDLHDYQLSLLVLPATLVIAAVLGFLIPERRELLAQRSLQSQ